MAHDRLPIPLPLPPPDDENEFDTSDVTKTRIRGVDAEVYIGGVERALDAVARAQVEGFAAVNQRIDAYAADLRHANDVAERNNKAITELTAEIRKVLKFALEMRGEQFKLADRVSTLEQPRKRARRK